MLAAIAALAERFPVLVTELRAAQDRLGERPMISRFVISPTPPKEDAPTSRPKQAPLGPKGPKKRAPQNP